MKPLVKYQGGKSRELKTIAALMPKKYNQIIEPFCGGAAVSFYFEEPAVLTDVNWQVINLYKIVAGEHYQELQDFVDETKTYDHDKLEVLYYKSRDVINDSNSFNEFDNASAYIIVRQLCFSGMERYSRSGKFNVPFGHYKSFSCNLSKSHHEFLKKCEISHASFEQCFKYETEKDFIFVDPPYLERLGYTSGDGGLELHEELKSCLMTTEANWMIVHSDHEFYRDQYNDFNIYVEDFVYSQRFGKNKNHSNAKVQHLYITNYPVEELAHPTVTQHLDAV